MFVEGRGTRLSSEGNKNWCLEVEGVLNPKGDEEWSIPVLSLFINCKFAQFLIYETILTFNVFNWSYGNEEEKASF